MHAEIRPHGPRVSRPSTPLVQGMVDRELTGLATARADDDGLRLRVLMRMLDRAQTVG